jgi:Protein of unknown function (DUF2842)
MAGHTRIVLGTFHHRARRDNWLERNVMTASKRKLAGTLLMLVYLAVYAAIALAIAAILQVNAGRIAEWIFYIVAGLAWVPGAAWIVSWMHR